MDLYASDDFKVRIGRWWRSMATLFQKAKRAAPTLCLIAGAGFGFWLSVGTGSWVLIVISMVLGAMLGRALLVAARYVLDNLATFVIGGVGLIGAVLLMISGAMIAGIVTVAAFLLLTSGIRAVLGI